MADPEFPEYATSHSQDARALCHALPAPQRAALIDIEDELAKDPGKYPERLTELAANLFIYKHPQPGSRSPTALTANARSSISSTSSRLR